MGMPLLRHMISILLHEVGTVFRSYLAKNPDRS